MDRRRFLKSVTGAATAVAAGGTAAAEAALSTSAQLGPAAPQTMSGGRTLRVGVSALDTTQGIADFAHQFAARLQAATDDTLSLELVTSRGNGMAAVARDEVDCYCATDHGHLEQAPELAFFAGLPGKTAMPGDVLHNWLTVGGGQQQWDQVSAEFDIKPLPIAHTGPQPQLWSKAPIDTLDVLSGKSVFAEGLAADVARSIGAHVAPASQRDGRDHGPGDELFAGEAGDFPTALAAGLPQSMRYASAPGLNRFGSVVTFGIKKSLWEALPSAQRILFEAAAAATYHESYGFTQTHHKMMAKASAEQNGTRYLNLAPDVEGAIVRVSDTVVAHLAASSPRASRINTSYMAFRSAAGLVG